MKLVRFGAPGREKPGIIDDKGRIRDLSKVVPDIAGETLLPKGLAKIRKTDLSKLPAVKAGTAARPRRRRHAPLRGDRIELCRPRRRDRRADTRRSRSSSRDICSNQGAIELDIDGITNHTCYSKSD